jgi:hypothetical protein
LAGPWRAEIFATIFATAFAATPPDTAVGGAR